MGVVTAYFRILLLFLQSINSSYLSQKDDRRRKAFNQTNKQNYHKKMKYLD